MIQGITWINETHNAGVDQNFERTLVNTTRNKFK